MAGWDRIRILPTAGWIAWTAALCAGVRGDVVPSGVPIRSVTPMTVTATTAPASATTEPSGAKYRSVKPFPKKYELLLTRSIFARRRGPGPGGGEGEATAEGTMSRGLVLRGVADQEGRRTALLEDTSSGKTRQLHVGDEALGGRIIAITMEGFDRKLGEQVLHVGVGQTLDGKGAPAGPATRQSLAREEGTPAAPDGAPGNAIPAGAKILEIQQ